MTKASGYGDIEHARARFEASVAKGEPDFRYIALAIGAAPIAPPEWAIRACIEEKEDAERIASTSSPDVPMILDEVVRLFDIREREYDETMRGWWVGRDADTKEEHPAFPRLPLERAIKIACDKLKVREERRDRASNVWMRDVIRAWTWEQANDAVHSYLTLEGFITTGRIARVLTAVRGPELYNLPEDPIRSLWENDPAPKNL